MGGGHLIPFAPLSASGGGATAPSAPGSATYESFTRVCASTPSISNQTRLPCMPGTALDLGHTNCQSHSVIYIDIESAEKEINCFPSIASKLFTNSAVFRAPAATAIGKGKACKRPQASRRILVLCVCSAYPPSTAQSSRVLVT